jgi:hypothetical protein
LFNLRHTENLYLSVQAWTNKWIHTTQLQACTPQQKIDLQLAGNLYTSSRPAEYPQHNWRSQQWHNTHIVK